MPEPRRALFCWRWLTADAGEASSEAQAFCWLDIEGSYVAMRPVLRRIYGMAVDAATYPLVLQRLRFQILPQAQVVLDDRHYHRSSYFYHTFIITFLPGFGIMGIKAKQNFYDERSRPYLQGY